MLIQTEDFGVAPYRDIWDHQKEIFNSLIDLKKNGFPIQQEYILIGEHKPVYTLGFHGKQENMLFTPEQLAKRGIDFIRIERGGDITYHGPGQMIVYPIIDLERHSLGVKQYMALLEECVISLLSYYGIKGERVDGATGVWIDVGTPEERKICAMGIKCSRYITMHGLALNVNTDLNAFNAINPCGFIDKGVTSMAREFDRVLDMSDIKKDFLNILISKLSN